MIKSKPSVQEPDACVFRDSGNINGLATSNALLLAIELSDSSLRDDLGPKRLSYAKAGVPHYWVVDINAAQTHVMGDPVKGDYGSHDTVPFGKSIGVPGTGRKVRIG